MFASPSSNSSIRRQVLRLGSVLALTLLAAMLLGGLWPASAAGTFLITESFTNAQPGPGWKLGGNATTTAASGIDPVGQGWLRLTQLANNQSGYAIYDVPFSSTNGVVLTFDYMTWGATTASNGADGLTVFLYDGSVPSTTFKPGAYGGSLGYAQRTGVTGVISGYVGIGIDEYGNYSNPTEGRVGGPGFRADTIAIRGPGNGTTGYAYLTGTLVGGSIDVYGVTTRPNPAGTGYRKVEIDIEPGADTYTITAKFQSGASGALKTIINQYKLPSKPPANLKIGFAASTGGYMNYHEIRNLNVTSSNAQTVLNGTVSSTLTNDAIPGATVRITDTAAHAYTMDVTGSGSYAFTNTTGTPLTAGPISVTATASGYCPATVRAQVVNGVTTTQDITLTPTTVSGLVLDAGTTVPIVGATVVLTDAVGAISTTTSGSGGAYSFSSSIGARLRSGAITITAWITDYAVYSSTAPIGACANTINLPLRTADLLLTKTDGRTTVAPGDVLTYTITITNLGTLTATNVIITDTLGSYLTYITDTTGLVASNPSPNVYQWTLPGNLAVNAGFNFKLRARVAAALPDGTTAINNTALATTSQVEADITQNIRQDPDTVTTHPNLAIFKGANSVQVLPSTNITYKYVIENRGYATATNVLITDVLDVNTSYTTTPAAEFVIGGAAQTITPTYYAVTHTVNFALPDLAPNAIGYFTYTARVTDTLSASAVTNTAQIGSAQSDLDAANNTSSVSLAVGLGPNLYVNTSAQPTPDPATPGGQILYTVRYGNLGTAAASNVVLTDIVPINTAYVADSLYLNGALLPDSTNYLDGSRMITVSWLSLIAGESGTLTFTVQITSPLNAGVENVSNTAWISSTGGAELTPGDNQVMATTTVNAQPALGVSVSKTPLIFLNNQPLTYTLTYQNTGNQTASNVIVTATILSNLTNVVAGDGGTYDSNTGLITWTFSSLPVDGPHTVTFTATISPTAPAGTLVAVRAAIGDDGANGVSADLSTTTALDGGAIVRSYLVLENRLTTPVYSGELITYTLAYHNAGAADAAGVVITDVVPADVLLENILNGGTESGGIITWSIGTVAAGASGTVGFGVRPLVASGNTNQPAPTLSTETGSGTIAITTTMTNVTSTSCDSERCTRFKTIWQDANSTGPAGWYDNPRLTTTNFDDAGWLGASTVITPEGYWTDPANLGAEWVTPKTETQFAPNYSFFRHSMCLPLNANDLQATLTIASDDQSSVYLNGELAGTHLGSGSASTLAVNTEIQSGINLLAIRLGNNRHGGHPDYDGGDHIGLLYNLSASYGSLRPFVAAPTTVLAGQPVTFTLDESAIGGRAPYSYTIDFGSGEGTQDYTTTATLSHTYASAGAYTATVTARAQLGCTGQNTIVINVAADGARLLINRAGVSYLNANGVSHAGESGVGATLNKAVHLNISNASAATSLVPGQSTVTYTVIVTNSGVETAANAGISDTVPAELTGVTWTCTPWGGSTCSLTGSGVISDTVSLPVGGTLTYLITGTLSSSALGDVVNAAYALAPSTFVNVGAGSATDSRPTETQTDLSIIKATGWITGVNLITYTITYSNTGPSDAREVFITDTLPVSVTYQGQVSATPAIDQLSPIGQAYTWYTATLPANSTGTIVYTVTINTGITGVLTNSISITSTTLDTSPANNVHEISVNAQSGTPTAIHVFSFSARTDTDRAKWLGLVAGLGVMAAWWVFRRRSIRVE